MLTVLWHAPAIVKCQKFRQEVTDRSKDEYLFEPFLRHTSGELYVGGIW